MMLSKKNPLYNALTSSAHCLRGNATVFAVPPDPLKLELPPLLAGNTLPKPRDIRILAAIYQQAELETADIIPLAEVLTRYRYELGLQDLDAARKLETFHKNSRDWYERRGRELLFARLFGLGPAASNRRTANINNDFQRLLAVFCQTANRYAHAHSWGRGADTMREAALRQSARNLLFNLARRQMGSALLAGRKIEAQLRAAVAILDHRGMKTHFGARSMWDVVRHVLGDQTPNLDRIATRAKSGLVLLKRLADLIPELLRDDLTRPLLRRGDSVFIHTARWLQATGLSEQDSRRTARRF